MTSRKMTTVPGLLALSSCSLALAAWRRPPPPDDVMISTLFFFLRTNHRAHHEKASAQGSSQCHIGDQFAGGINGKHLGIFLAPGHLAHLRGCHKAEPQRKADKHAIRRCSHTQIPFKKR